MTRPHPGPFTVSNLRHHRRQRTLAVMLAVVGAAACGGESPVAPAPRDASSPSKIVAPPGANFFMNYATPNAQAQIEARREEAEATRWGGEVDPGTPIPAHYSVGVSLLTPSFSLAVPAARAPVRPRGPTGVPTGRSLPRSRVRTPTGPGFMYYYDCDLEYTECVLQCLTTRMDFRTAAADFWRADDEFWTNILTGRAYLNGLVGGPQDKMWNSFRQMSSLRAQYVNYECSRYL